MATGHALTAFIAGGFKGDYVGRSHTVVRVNELQFQFPSVEDIIDKCLLRTDADEIYVNGHLTSFKRIEGFLLIDLRNQTEIRPIIVANKIIKDAYILSTILGDKTRDETGKINVSYTRKEHFRIVGLPETKQEYGDLVIDAINPKKPYENRRSKTWLAGIRFVKGAKLSVSYCGISATLTNLTDDDYYAIEELYDIPHDKDRFTYPFCAADFATNTYYVGPQSGVNIGLEFYVKCNSKTELLLMDDD